MIVAVFKELLKKEELKDSKDEFILLDRIESDSDNVLNLNQALLLSDAGLKVIVQINDINDFVKLEIFAVNNPLADIVYVHADTDLISHFTFTTDKELTKQQMKFIDIEYQEVPLNLNVLKVKDVDFFIEPTRTLKRLVRYYSRKYPLIFLNKNSKYSLISGITKDGGTTTLFSDNICTIFKDRQDTEDINYYLELNISSSEELKKIITYYIDDSFTKEIDNEVFLEAQFSAKSLSKIYDKLYVLASLYL